MSLLHSPGDSVRRAQELWPRERLAEFQLARLNALLDEILPRNGFYAAKLGSVLRPLASLDHLKRLPFTTKDELVEGRSGAGLARNRTYPLDRYVRYHRTSGTRGYPLVVLDTRDDWQWWIDTWQFVLDAADVSARDHVFMAFSFGPFIGFWSAHDAIVARGALTVPGGGLGTTARLELILTSGSTVVCCTPSYALHLAEVAAREGINLRTSGVTRVIVAGEPGGSIPAIRERIESAWNARVVDHAGATEVGPWGYADRGGRGVHVVESEFVAEFLIPGTDQPAPAGELAEVVLTNLGRYGSPVIRYRTGDLARARYDETGRNHFVLLDGGVLGRTDDMLIVRGVNVFPTSVEAILRGIDGIDEYRLIARKEGVMDDLRVEVEDRLSAPDRVARELQLRLGLRVDVICVPGGSLPRFEGKGRRFVDQRRENR